MKVFQKFIIYLSIFTFLSISILSPLKVYADVPQSQIVVSHQGTWGGYAFNYSLLGKYFTVEDSTGIPSSSPNNSQYFYTDDNITFYALSGKDLYTAILNRGIGLVVTGSFLDTLYNGFMQIIQVSDTETHTYMQGALYDNNDTFLGYCVNDISGCYYQQPQPADTPAVDVPDELTDDVWYHYKYYVDNDDTLPDFITVTPPSREWILSKILESPNSYISVTQWNDWLAQNINTLYQHDNIYSFIFGNSGGTGNTTYSKYMFGSYLKLDGLHYIAKQSNINTSWSNICSFYNITKDDPNLLFSDMYSKFNNNSNLYLDYQAYNSSDTNITSFNRYIVDVDTTNRIINGWGTSPDPYTQTYFKLGCNYNSTQNQWYNGSYVMIGKPYTIYKDENAYHSIRDKTYSPDSIPSSTYINYSPNNDNSFTLTYNNIDNSTTNNDTIYNDSHDIYYDNTDDGNIDTIEISIQVEEIINLVIPQPVPDPGPNPNPNPENPDEPNIEDDTVLDAILAALKRFFDVIGKILGTVLAGLLEVIDTILESIAGIMENFTGIIDIFTTMFAWIPSPVPQVLGLGLSICILAAIIKFIRG